MQSDLEIVQVRAKDDQIQCRITPRLGKPVSVLFDSAVTAFSWLVGVLEDKKISLFVLKDLELTDECARIQMAISPRSIQLVSMSNVCLFHIDPDNFQLLIRNPFKAKKYTFTSLENVHPGSFCDNLLLSDAFLHAMSIEIHISDFLPDFDQRISRLSEEGILHWYFNGPQTVEPRYFICNSVQLGSTFLHQLLETFKKEIVPKATTVILYGQAKQYKEYVMEHLQGRDKLIIKNEATGELLKIQYLVEEKLEIQRVLESAVKHIRPMNSPGPCCAMSYNVV